MGGALKPLLGMLLLPCCVALTRTCGFLLRGLDLAGDKATGLWALGIGFLLWVVLYLSMSRPVRTYVLGHELTHALWAFLMGASVSRLKVGKKGGSVTLSKSNALITLAPYFFPFYTVCVVLAYGLISLFWDMGPYQLFWLGLVGLSYGFHLTFTLSMLAHRQTDVEAYGRLLSYTLIYALNVLGVCFWLVAVAKPGWGDFTGRLAADLAWVGQVAWAGWGWTRGRLGAGG